MNKKDFIEVKPLLKFLDEGIHYLELCVKYSFLSNDETIKGPMYEGVLDAYRFIFVHIEDTVKKMAKEISKNNTEENYGIPVNDYKVPTGIREDVVRDIAKNLLKRMEKEQELLIWDNNKGLYLGDGSIYYDYIADGDVRIRGVEMQAAFEALHKAGYFLYGEYCISNGYHTYVWSKKPIFNGKKPLEKPVFSAFID